VADFDLSMRLHRPEEPRVKAERKPLDWSKAMTAIQICGAILTIPVGAAGVYAAYRSNFSVEVSCQTLRTTIISTLEKNVDMDTRRALARRDVAEFERSCAAIDPDAKRVFAGLMAPKAEPATTPAAMPELAKPVVKANAAPHDLINEAIEREAARVPAQVKAPATVATPLTTPAVRHSAAPANTANTAKPGERPQGEKPAMAERAAARGDAPKADRPGLGEPPAPLGKITIPAEVAGPRPLPAVTPAMAPRTAALPTTEPVSAPDTTATPMGGPIPPAAPPPLETATVPAPPYGPPVAARAEPAREPAREPAKKSGLSIPFVSDLFGGAPPRPPGEIARDTAPENGPAN
jgi:hypothetical protein